MWPGRTRFSVWTFWPSFVSMTCSVGTTTRRNLGAWFIEVIRCSRLVFTLISWPEYVLMTYHLNISAPPSDAAESLGRQHQARGRTRTQPRLVALARSRVDSGAACW